MSTTDPSRLPIRILLGADFALVVIAATYLALRAAGA